MKQRIKGYLTMTSLLALIGLPLQAAEVPAGTSLAAEQVFIRNITTEPASIDPQKVEENAGSEVVNDLFEGLFSQGSKGELRLAGATS